MNRVEPLPQNATPPPRRLWTCHRSPSDHHFSVCSPTASRTPGSDDDGSIEELQVGIQPPVQRHDGLMIVAINMLVLDVLPAFRSLDNNIVQGPT